MALQMTKGAVPLGDYVPSADQRVSMFGRSWSEFETLLSARGERPVPRIAFLDGEIELMSPSTHHEHYRANIGRMLQDYCVERGIPVAAYGSWTLKRKPQKASLEPDDCYVFGGQRKSRPDLAIEVVWTSGGIEKLEIYRRVGVPEVWFWERGAIAVFVLHGARYRRGKRSRFVPDLDLSLVCKLVSVETINELRARFLAALRK